MDKERTMQKSLSWSFLEKILGQGTSIVISIILARLLSPDDYGFLAIVNVFIILANVFVENSIGVALIQDPTSDEITFSTDFFLSIILGCVLYTILYLSAPFIAAFYAMPELEKIIRVLSLKIPISSVYMIQYSIVSRRMEFQKLVLPTFIATLISGISGIIAASFGLGVWALVIQALLMQLIMVVMFFIMLEWRPKLLFSATKAKAHLLYSIKVVAAELINNIVAQLHTLVIGKWFSSADVAYYNNGVLYPQKIVGIIDSAVNEVVFPAIANEKNDFASIKLLMRSTVKNISFLIVPMMVGLAVCADHVVSVFLTDKWLPSVPYLQLVCMTFVFLPINGVNYEAVKAIGKSSLFLKLQIVKTVFNVAVLLIALPYGMMAIAWTGFIGGFATTALNVYPAWKYIGYGLLQQLRDLFLACLYSVPMVIVILLMNRFIHCSDTFMLFLEVMSGAVLYFVTAVLLHSESLKFYLNMLKRN